MAVSSESVRMQFYEFLFTSGALLRGYTIYTNPFRILNYNFLIGKTKPIKRAKSIWNSYCGHKIDMGVT